MTRQLFQSIFTVRGVVAYGAALLAAVVLTEVVWGFAGGVVAGYTIARSPGYQQQVQEFLKTRGIDTKADAAVVQAACAGFSAEDRAELNRMSEGVLREANWFLVTLAVSILVFGLVGFSGGWLARDWRLAALVPALTFALNNPLVRFPLARELAISRQVVIGLVQVGVCVVLAALGSRVAARRQAALAPSLRVRTDSRPDSSGGMAPGETGPA
ncbi:MAG: hypothetical protein K8T26_00375 [Lentisphaerae bacterium]|nr:hypothetical protein [Lentisphaerota bacterium]